MTQLLRQSTQVIVVIGPAVAVGDGFTPVTSLDLSTADEAELLKANTTTTSSIAAATFAAITGCDGWYGLTLTTTHTDTVGPLTVMVNDDSLILPIFMRFQVLEEAAYDAIYAASAPGPATPTNITAGTITTATNVTTVNGLAANVITATSIANDAITAAKIAAGAIDAATFAADVDAEILSYLVDDATRIDASALNTASVTTIPAIVADTNELQTDWANGGRLDLILDARASQASVDTIDGIVDAILLDTAEIGAAGAGLTAVPWNAAWDAEVQSEVTDALNAYDPPTKAETDALLTTALTESYAADGAAPTLTQALYAIQQFLQEKAISGTTMTVNKLDGTTAAMTFTLDSDTAPTTITRAT